MGQSLTKTSGEKRGKEKGNGQYFPTLENEIPETKRN